VNHLLFLLTTEPGTTEKKCGMNIKTKLTLVHM